MAPVSNQFPLQGRVTRDIPSVIQNRTYTTTKDRCSHNGGSASCGTGCCPGGFSRFAEVDKVLGLFRCNKISYDFSDLMRLATSRKSIFEPYTSMKFARADFLSPEASYAAARS